jgi:hypothetical protein
MARNDMNDLTQKLIVALVVIPILLAIFQLGWKEMTVAATAIGLALCFANIDKIARFKGAGIEAEMRTVVDKAYAAIEQLKELGLNLSSPIIDEMAVSGRITKFIHLKYKLQRVATIEETLRKLGASEKEIDGATATIYQRVTGEHVERILRSLRTSNPAKKSFFEGLDDGRMSDWDKARLDQFIKDNDLQVSNDGAESILDLDFFLKNKKLRREDQWQS